MERFHTSMYFITNHTSSRNQEFLGVLSMALQILLRRKALGSTLSTSDFHTHIHL